MKIGLNPGAEMDSQLDEIIELVGRDLDGRASRARIQQIVAEVSARFRYAAIIFVPIFVRRITRERLSEEIRLGDVRL